MVGMIMIDNDRWRDKEQPRQARARPWWQAVWQRVQGSIRPASQPVAANDPSARVAEPLAGQPRISSQHSADPQSTIRYGVRTSTLALAVTTAGRLFYPPLQVAGLPLLVYMGIPSAQQAYREIEEEEGDGRALAETVVLTVCLVSGYYWVGALGFWLYYGSRALLAEKEQSQEVHQRRVWLAPTTTQRRQDGTLCVVPTASLQPGDQVILRSGEVAPADGLIIEGVAWLRPQGLPSTADDLRKGVGDKVTATDLVLVGQIFVQVLPTD